MNSKLEIVTDSNMLAGEIMREIDAVDKMERLLNTELDSSDLFRIDCAILTSLKNTQDFSRDLLKQLEEGKFETIKDPPKRDIMHEIQQETILDITKPLQEMFDSLSIILTDVLGGQ